MEKDVYIHVCDGIADWEMALAAAMISKTRGDFPKNKTYNVVTFSLDKQPIKTMGEINILPDICINDIDISKVAMVLLPGARVYLDSDVSELVSLIDACTKNGVPVATICNSTVLLARNGFLDTVQHTSNGPKWLKKMAPNYLGEKNYEHKPSVSDGGFITASLFGQVEFTYNILKTLEVFTPQFLELWFTAFKNGYVNLDPFLGIDSE
jgi:putative intracellular protease/amidase